MREWKAAYDKLKTVAKVIKPVTLVSIDEATEGGKADIWNAFRESSFGEKCAEH
jgi:amidase